MPHTHPLSSAEKLAWLRLSRTSNIGPVSFARLIARFGSAAAALDGLPRLARRGGGDAPTAPVESDIRRELETLAAMGGHVVASCEPEYPPGLAALESPPPLLMVLGHIHLLARDMVAIVGARNASALGRKLAGMIAVGLGAAELTVVSGMARGIDAAAHEGALATGTCAVLAGGVDVIYPPENTALYERIRSQGVVLSEMQLGQAPQARHFPRRNRIISGLSRGVVIVEAAQGSGSLITANYALEQGREIFAVPGSPLDPRAKGTNRLIRDGATLTESADDVLAVLRAMLGRDFREPPAEDTGPVGADASTVEAEADRIRDTVLELLGPAAVETDELIRQARAHPAAVLTVLLELEIAGRLSRQPGNRVTLA